MGRGTSLVMGGAIASKEDFMAEEESLLASPPTQDTAVHVQDYLRFTKLFKWGAIVCLIIGFIILLILKS